MFYACLGCGFLGFEYINRLHVDIFVVTSSVVSILSSKLLLSSCLPIGQVSEYNVHKQNFKALYILE